MFLGTRWPSLSCTWPSHWSFLIWQSWQCQHDQSGSRFCGLISVSIQKETSINSSDQDFSSAGFRVQVSYPYVTTDLMRDLCILVTVLLFSETFYFSRVFYDKTARCFCAKAHHNLSFSKALRLRSKLHQVGQLWSRGLQISPAFGDEKN
jgi:hypothetical protein